MMMSQVLNACCFNIVTKSQHKTSIEIFDEAEMVKKTIFDWSWDT